jgi:hypothetical protein
VSYVLHRCCSISNPVLLRFPESALAIASTAISSEYMPAHMFRSIDTILGRIYPPPPELKPACIHFLRYLKDTISSSPKWQVVPMLVTLTRSLCRWIEDDAQVFSDDEYNDVVRVAFAIVPGKGIQRSSRSCLCMPVHCPSSDPMLQLWIFYIPWPHCSPQSSCAFHHQLQDRWNSRTSGK